MTTKHTMTVELNGTSENPYHRLGLTQNPFPQVGKHEWNLMVLQVQKLGGDPIPDVQYIRDTLKGFTPEFIELCCNNFRKGQMVTFTMEFPE